MTEQQFLNELDDNLKKLHENERHDIRRDFIEYFEHGRLEGKTTAQIIESLGPIEELAEEILAAYEEEALITNTATYFPPADTNSFQNIHVNSTNTNLTIRSADVTEPYVDIQNENNDSTVTMTINGDKLHVNIEAKTKYYKILFVTIIRSASAVDATLYLPKMHYNEVIANNENGNIKLKNMQFRNGQLHSENGRIVIQKCLASIVTATSDNSRVTIEESEIEQIQANSSNGNVIAENCTAKHISLKSSNGNIQCYHSTGQLEAYTSNSNIKIELTQATGDIHAETNNGDITLKTSELLKNCRIQLKTNNGSTSVYGTKTKLYQNGNEQYLLKLKSSNGNIKIKQFEQAIIK